MEQGPSIQDARVTELTGAAEAPAGIEDLPAAIPETAGLNIAPAPVQTPAADSGTVPEGVQQEAVLDDKQEAPAAQPQSAAADIQQAAHAGPEASPGPGTAAEDPAELQTAAEPARQQTGAVKKKKGAVLIKVGTQWVEVVSCPPDSM